MVFPHHRHGSRVLGSVAAAPFAVVVGGIGIEAGAGVVGIAFAGFFFGRCFSAGFLGGKFFSFDFFGRAASSRFRPHMHPVTARRRCLAAVSGGSPCPLAHLRTAHRRLTMLGTHLHPGLAVVAFVRFPTFAAASQQQRDDDQQ